MKSTTDVRTALPVGEEAADNWREAPSGSQPVLSIVVIGRNEEHRLAGCLKSVIGAGIRTGQPFEVIYVDSASADKSADIAYRFPVTVLRIEPGEWRCAAAGRYLGSQHAQGLFIAHFDADMLCAPDWLRFALSYFQDRQVGLVSGNLIDIVVDNPGHEFRRHRKFYSTITDKCFPGGAFVVSRSALVASGGFDPYMIAVEEAEFTFRVRSAGFKTLGVPHSMGEHRTSDWTSWQEIRRRRDSGYFTGYGQALRRIWHTSNRWRYVWGIKVPLALAFWLLLVITMFLAAIVARSYLIVFAAIISILGVLAAFVWRCRDLRQGLALGLSQPFVLEGLVRGLVLPVPKASYRPNITWLKQGPLLLTVTDQVGVHDAK